MADEKIWIVTDVKLPRETQEGRRGWRAEVNQQVQGFRDQQLDVAELETRMGRFLQMVGRLFYQAERQASPQSKMQLDEVELSVEISAEGEIKLVTGIKAAGKGAIKLKFKRVPLEIEGNYPT